MRRLIIILSAMLIALGAAIPVQAAESSHYRASGSSAAASYTNTPEEWDAIEPGTYFHTGVWASEYLTMADGESFEDSGVCVYHETFSIDDQGEWVEGTWLEACAGGADLTISRRLTGASLVGSIPASRCLEWDEASGECTDTEDLGTVEVDLDLAGFGPISRYHGTGNGGTAGAYQYAYHGSGADRAATPSGTVVLVAPDGSETDLTFGEEGDGYLARSSEGWIDISISGAH